jgi:SAM-dependent MidA family methyltransferase
MLSTQSFIPALVKMIREEIRSRGPQSFAWFMAQALYHPEHGYYSTDRAAIGRRGDYFTNDSVGPLFGELLAAQFAEIWERLGRVDNFLILEQGAHHGQFARDVLESARRRSPEFFSGLRYQIVEPFSALQDRQSQGLKEFGDRVLWRRSLDELEPFVGVHFSNELLDAMPVNLHGKLVGLEGDKLVFVEGPGGTPMNQAVLDWIDCLSTKLERGFVIAVDYGFSRAEFREVLQVRAKHRALDSPFDEIGEADITTHVNWTDLAERAQANGLRLAGFTDQHHFLTGIISEFGRGGPPRRAIGSGPEAAPPANASPARTDWGQSPLSSDSKTKRALQTLLHPEMLGRSFQVLALEKDVDLAEPLSGFKFARNPCQALGL